MKYIIRNCPAFNDDNYAECEAVNLCHIQCFDNTGCFLKRIVEASKRVYNSAPISSAAFKLAESVLDEFDFGEIDD